MQDLRGAAGVLQGVPERTGRLVGKHGVQILRAMIVERELMALIMAIMVGILVFLLIKAQKGN